MLRSMKSVFGYHIQATDGSIGRVHDFYFDDASWTARYLVADTGKWLPGRRVLLSPAALDEPAWETATLPVRLTRQQIQNSPDVSTDEPVSRQKEMELSQYYTWPIYWGAPEIGPAMVPPPVAEHPPAEKQHGDPHLRSAREVIGYTVHARDGEIGHVEDFISDDKSWILRYLVTDTGKWVAGKKVLIAPQWVSTIRWEDQAIHVDLDREGVRNSPPYDPHEPVNREHEIRLYDYYGRPRYWV